MGFLYVTIDLIKTMSFFFVFNEKRERKKLNKTNNMYKYIYLKTFNDNGRSTTTTVTNTGNTILAIVTLQDGREGCDDTGTRTT
jgi:hypothetical protein